MLVVVKRQQSNQDTGTCSCPRVRAASTLIIFFLCTVLFWAVQYETISKVAHFWQPVWVKKVAPLNFFCNIFTKAKYTSVKFCHYVASLYLHIFTNFGRYISIFNKIELIFFSEYPSFLTFLVLRFINSNRRNFIANNEWSPVHPTSIHWIISLGGNAGVLLQAATEAKNSSQVYRCTLDDSVCLAGERHWQPCERQPQLTAAMCVSQRWKFWTCNVKVRIRDTNCYI